MVRLLFARVLGVALALGLFEGLVRQVYVSSLVWEAGYGFIVEPGSSVTWGREGHGRSHWTTNGIRGTSPRTQTGAVLALGDSFTEAFQVDDDEAYPAVLERELVERSVPMPVFNAGRSSASVADFIAFAPRFRRIFSPRWTLVQLRDNDLTSDAWEPAKVHFVETNGVLSTQLMPTPVRGRIGSILWALRQKVMILGMGFVRAGELHRAVENEPALFRAGAITATATPRQVDRPVEAELDLLFDAYEGRVTILYLSVFDPKMPFEQTPTEARVMAYCARKNRSCVSIREGFPELWKMGRAPYGHVNTAWNEGHMNADGHRLAAKRVAEELTKLSRDGLL